MSQPAARVDMRTTMPMTADWVDKKRTEWGKDHVNACIRNALAGQAGHFYAIENGHVLGVPFPASDPLSKWQDYAVMVGTKFAGFMREPAKAPSA